MKQYKEASSFFIYNMIGTAGLLEKHLFVLSYLIIIFKYFNKCVA
jgi:hypothetical protein